MFGETVLAREFGGTPVVCKVWEVTSHRIYVCTEEVFKKLAAHKGKPFPANCFPVAFPKEDIFRYNPKQKAVLDKWDGDLKIWEHLVNYV